MTLLNSIISRRGAARAENRGSDFGRAIKPMYDVRETDEAYGMTVYLPGVSKDGIEITAEQGQLIIRGRRAWKRPEGWTALYTESADAPFELVLEHDNAIDTGKVAAEMHDGVLRVSLPKTEAVKPRKITVS